MPDPGLSLLAVDGSALQWEQVVTPYLGVFAVALLVSFTMTPVMRLLARRNGVVDWPDLARKEHPQPVAYLGGVAVFLGWLTAVIASYVTTPHTHAEGFGPGYVSFPVSVMLGAGAVAVTGLFDDVYRVSPRIKFGGQLFAAAALSSQETGLNLVAHASAAIGAPCADWVAYLLGGVLIAGFVLGGCNAMNLLDGLDGLATGVGAIAMSGFLVMAAMLVVRHGDQVTASHILNDPVRLVMCLAALGALLGFLPYNFHPATIFLGDAGSLLVGYLCVATMLLFSSSEPGSLLIVTACLVIFAVPIVDTALAIFRRTLRGRPILSPDSEHLHHLLRRSGLTVRQAAMVLYAIAGLFAATGVMLVALEVRWRYMLMVLVAGYGLLMIAACRFAWGRRATQPGEPAAGPKSEERATTASQTGGLARGSGHARVSRAEGPEAGDPASLR